jgi:hypothetical protein
VVSHSRTRGGGTSFAEEFILWNKTGSRGLNWLIGEDQEDHADGWGSWEISISDSSNDLYVYFIPLGDPDLSFQPEGSNFGLGIASSWKKHGWKDNEKEANADG